MPQTTLMKLECDGCKAVEMVDTNAAPKDILPILSKWRGVLPGDAPNDGKNHTRWYCKLQCLVDGEQALALHALKAHL